MWWKQCFLLKQCYHLFFCMSVCGCIYACTHILTGLSACMYVRKLLTSNIPVTVNVVRPKFFGWKVTPSVLLTHVSFRDDSLCQLQVVTHIEQMFVRVRHIYVFTERITFWKILGDTQFQNIQKNQLTFSSDPTGNFQFREWYNRSNMAKSHWRER